MSGIETPEASSPQPEDNRPHIEVLFINNAGGGFAGKKAVLHGSTLIELVNNELPNATLADLKIKVNREDVVLADYVLQAGDRVSVTFNKHEGN